MPSGGFIGGGGATPAATGPTNLKKASGHGPPAKRQKKKAKKRLKRSEPVIELAPRIDRTEKEIAAAATASFNAQKPWLSCPADTFEWMISPVKPSVFFAEYWEKKPLVIRRKRKGFYQKLFGAEALDKLLREHPVKFGLNLDVTKYVDGERETLNPEGRAHANVVWALYEEGCSVRLLNPQTYDKQVWALCASLQEYFGCMVGANTYLTPRGTQGFAPHYDDIEAFILQLEGKKRWRMYNNPSGERLPRTSSANFAQEELGEVILDITLEPGDLLYFPRGIVHQGVAPEEGAEHSHHITVSSYQKFDWSQYLSKLIPRSLELAAEQDVEFRQGLPRNFLSYMGLVHAEQEQEDPRRTKFIKRAKHLITKLIEGAPFDAAADQVGIDFIHESLPPFLLDSEVVQSDKAKPNDGRTLPIMGPDSEVRVVRPLAARMVLEDDRAVVYYNTDNSRLYKGEELQSSEYPLVSR